MKKSDKVLFVEGLASKIESAKSLVLLDPSALKVNQQQVLRRRLKEVDGTILVAKNTLIARALKQAKNFSDHLSGIKDSLSGQTAIVIAADDELAPLQVLGKFIKEFELPKLKVGILNNQIQDGTRLLTLSRLPEREVMAGQAVGALMGPLYGIVAVLQGKLQELVYILDQKAKGGDK